jgi:hypothetical protein
MRGTYEAANSLPEETRIASATFVVKAATTAARAPTAQPARASRRRNRFGDDAPFSSLEINSRLISSFPAASSCLGLCRPLRSSFPGLSLMVFLSLPLKQGIVGQILDGPY